MAATLNIDGHIVLFLCYAGLHFVATTRLLPNALPQGSGYGLIAAPAAAPARPAYYSSAISLPTLVAPLGAGAIILCADSVRLVGTFPCAARRTFEYGPAPGPLLKEVHQAPRGATPRNAVAPEPAAAPGGDWRKHFPGEFVSALCSVALPRERALLVVADGTALYLAGTAASGGSGMWDLDAAALWRAGADATPRFFRVAGSGDGVRGAVDGGGDSGRFGQVSGIAAHASEHVGDGCVRLVLYVSDAETHRICAVSVILPWDLALPPDDSPEATAFRERRVRVAAIALSQAMPLFPACACSSARHRLLFAMSAQQRGVPGRGFAELWAISEVSGRAALLVLASPEFAFGAPSAGERPGAAAFGALKADLARAFGPTALDTLRADAAPVECGAADVTGPASPGAALVRCVCTDPDGVFLFVGTDAGVFAVDIDAFAERCHAKLQELHANPPTAEERAPAPALTGRAASPAGAPDAAGAAAPGPPSDPSPLAVSPNSKGRDQVYRALSRKLSRAILAFTATQQEEICRQTVRAPAPSPMLLAILLRTIVNVGEAEPLPWLRDVDAAGSRLTQLVRLELFKSPRTRAPDAPADTALAAGVGNAVEDAVSLVRDCNLPDLLGYLVFLPELIDSAQLHRTQRLFALARGEAAKGVSARARSTALLEDICEAFLGAAEYHLRKVRGVYK